MENKDLNYYLSLNYPFRIETIPEEDGSGFLISYPDLEGCISDGDTIEEALKMGEDAKRCWIEARIKEDLHVPDIGERDDGYSGRITLRTPKTLHRKLSEVAAKEGVSLNQYLLYLVSKGV